jgi:hypothetical protein
VLVVGILVIIGVVGVVRRRHDDEEDIKNGNKMRCSFSSITFTVCSSIEWNNVSNVCGLTPHSNIKTLTLSKKE